MREHGYASGGSNVAASVIPWIRSLVECHLATGGFANGVNFWPVAQR